jgi:hypothetical protein
MSMARVFWGNCPRGDGEGSPLVWGRSASDATPRVGGVGWDGQLVKWSSSCVVKDKTVLKFTV